MLKNESLKNSEIITSYSTEPIKFDENGLATNANNLSKEAIEAFLSISGFELVQQEEKKQETKIPDTDKKVKPTTQAKKN